jgi:hypothetical protein
MLCVLVKKDLSLQVSNVPVIETGVTHLAKPPFVSKETYPVK